MYEKEKIENDRLREMIKDLEKSLENTKMSSKQVRNPDFLCFNKVSVWNFVVEVKLCDFSLVFCKFVFKNDVFVLAVCFNE